MSKEFNYLFDIAEAKTRLFDKNTQPLSWGHAEGRFEALKEIKEWLTTHDAEIRKQVIAELEKWNDACSDYGYEIIDYEDLQGKLNEMKGEER